MKNCTISVTGGTLPEKELEAYKKRAIDQFGRLPVHIDVKVDGDYVDLAYNFGQSKFDRIRRITGYLVGTLDRFNDAKRHEEHDRDKHGLASA